MEVVDFSFSQFSHLHFFHSFFLCLLPVSGDITETLITRGLAEHFPAHTHTLPETHTHIHTCINKHSESASLPCGLHKFCLKYFLKTFATLSRRDKLPDLLSISCGVAAAPCFHSILKLLCARSLLVLTQFVLTFAQLTQPLSCWTNFVANPTDSDSRCHALSI